MTTNDGVSRVTRQAFTVGRVIKDGTLGAMATHARTGIDTLLVDTCARFGTVGVDDAFWATFHIRVSVVFGHTPTGGGSIALLTYGV